MKPIKIFLDDIRETPDGWERCYWPNQVIMRLQSYLVSEISLDHDLGDAEMALSEDRKEITGYDVLEWIEEQVFLFEYTPPLIRIHSQNGPGIERMNRAIESIRRFVSERVSA